MRNGSVAAPAGGAGEKPAGRPGGRESLALLALLAFFGILAVLWALFIPVPAAGPDAVTWDGYNPDEQVHLRLIAYLASRHALPLFGAPGSDTIYTVVHPPLYHLAAAVVYAAAEPLLGYGGTVVLLRILTALLGMGVVALTFRTARLLFPPLASLFAAGVVAGVPMFVSLSGAVTNEVAAAFLASGAIWSMARGLRFGFDRRRTIALSLWVAAGILTKLTCLPLLPTALLALWIAPRRGGGGPARPPAGRFAAQAAVLLGVVLIATGWWFARNQRLYGDPLLAGAHYRFWSATVAVPWWRMMTVPRFFVNGLVLGWNSFWGVFDAFTRPLPDFAYLVILAIQLPAVVGFVVWAKRGGLRPAARWRSALVMALFAAFTVGLFYAVNWRIYAPQGRYLFPLLTPLGAGTAAGLLGPLPRRDRPAVAAAALAALLLVNLYALAVMSVRPEGGKGAAPATAAPEG